MKKKEIIIALIVYLGLWIGFIVTLVSRLTTVPLYEQDKQTISHTYASSKINGSRLTLCYSDVDEEYVVAYFNQMKVTEFLSAVKVGDSVEMVCVADKNGSFNQVVALKHGEIDYLKLEDSASVVANENKPFNTGTVMSLIFLSVAPIICYLNYRYRQKKNLQ